MLATEIQNKLALDLRPNTYTVTYLANHRFEFRRATGANTFTLRWTTSTAALRTELGFNNARRHRRHRLHQRRTSRRATSTSSARTPGTDNPTDGTTQYYRAYSRRFFNGQVMSLLPDGRVCTVVQPAPVGLPGGPGTDDLLDPFNPLAVPANAPYIILDRRAACTDPPNPAPIRMEFAGAVGWAGATAGNTCGGFENLVPLQPCTNNAQFNIISDHMWPEVRIRPDGSMLGYTETAAGDIATAPTGAGIRAAGFTPLAESLEDLKTVWNALWAGSISLQTPRPRTFAIIVTDGDDTCPTARPRPAAATTSRHCAPRTAPSSCMRPSSRVDPASSVTTFVVAFGSGVSANRANWIAWGGSGMVKATPRARAIPSAGPRFPPRRSATACSTCRDAFVAANADATHATRCRRPSTRASPPASSPTSSPSPSRCSS